MHKKISIGSKAPDFSADSTFGRINLSDYRGGWVVLFSHPDAFAPVCTTEFIALSKKADEFAKRNTQLIGIGTDSNLSHLAWLYAIKMTTGISTPFPLITDRGGKISSLYGMQTDKNNGGSLLRNVYIIDPDMTIRTILIYPNSTGRSVDEILRILSSLQLADAENAVTPANWREGEEYMYPAPCNFKELVINENEKDIRYNNWMLSDGSFLCK